MTTPDVQKKLKAAANLSLCGGFALALLGGAYLLLSPRVWDAVALVRVRGRGAGSDPTCRTPGSPQSQKNSLPPNARS